MRKLFDRSKKTISEHLQNLFEEGELEPDSVVRNFRTTAADGKSYDVAHYNLEAILAVGFRVKSRGGNQFRRWANTSLRELIVKGFVIFLEQAELRAKQKQDLTLDCWRGNVDRMLEFNEQAVLDGPGTVSREQMKEIAEGRYVDFDDMRREAEAIEADAEDLRAIENLEKDLKRKGGGDE